MDIKYIEKPSGVPFCEIPCNTEFRVTNILYVKLSHEVSVSHNTQSYLANAMEMGRSILVFFDNDVKVIPVKVEVTYKDL